MLKETGFQNSIILINKEGMGYTNQDNSILQYKLLDTYFNLLIQSNTLPSAICFYTDGVKLVVEGSPLLEKLTLLEKRGVRLIICSTCLNYFGIADKVRVGIAGGMPDIIEAQVKADKVITL